MKISTLIENPMLLEEIGKVERDTLTPLWTHSYYDGDLSGALIYEDRLHWFVMVDGNEEEGDWFRRYGIARLCDETIKLVKQRHDSFCQHVGCHYDYDGSWSKRKSMQPRPSTEWHRYYDKYRDLNLLSYDDMEVVAWFEW